MSAVLDCQLVFPENDGKTASEALRPDHSKNAQSAVCIAEDS